MVGQQLSSARSGRIARRGKLLTESTIVALGRIYTAMLNHLWVKSSKPLLYSSRQPCFQFHINSDQRNNPTTIDSIQITNHKVPKHHMQIISVLYICLVKEIFVIDLIQCSTIEPIYPAIFLVRRTN